MRINKDEFLKNMYGSNYTVTTCAAKMEISREYLWYVLENKRRPGNKFISGLRKAFPDKSIESFLVN